MDQQLQAQITALIGDARDMTIATNREDGFPQATTVSYVSDGLTIYFMTPADSQKAQNIAKNNKVSLTINRHYEDWQHIEGLSMGALAVRTDDPAEQEKIGTLLLEKFPEAAQYESTVNVDLAFFRVEPKVISLLDYKKGFGHTEMVTL